MSLLTERIRKDVEKKNRAARSVESVAVHPTATEQEMADQVIQTVSEQFKEEISKSGLSEDVQKKIREYVKGEIFKIPVNDYTVKARIEKVVLSSIIGLGPIDSFLHDPEITEIIVQRFNHISIERNGLVEQTDAEFVSEEHLMTVINRIIQPVGRQINLHTPLVDARLKDGSRVTSTIPPISPDGATLTIRRFPEKAYTGEDYLAFHSLDEKMLYFLMKAVEGKASTIVSGGTGSGKTTLLNMLLLGIPENELVVTIEDSCELKHNRSNIRRLEARIASAELGIMSVSVRALVKNALRMRPDRIIVGEIRDETIVDMVSAMSTGHEGSLSTVHANSPTNLINARMPILYSMYGDSAFTPEAQAIQLSEALDLIVHVSRMVDGTRKITHITHVAGLEQRRLKLQDIFVYRDGKFHATGYIPKKLLEKMKNNKVTVDESIFNRM